MPPKRTLSVTITAADAQGGVHYAPKPGEPGKDLLHGETHPVEEDFARMLIHQKRAVLAEGEDDLESRPLTTESFSRDPEALHADAPKQRKR